MRKSNRRVDIFSWSIVLLSAFLLSGCATTAVPKQLPVQSQQWKKVAFVQEMILPPSLPSVFSSLQAGIYRGSFSKIEADVVKLHQDRIDGFEEILGQQLQSTCFPFTVIYGKELLKVDAFKNLDSAIVKTFEASAAGRKDNSMVIPTRGYNFFDFSMNDADPKKVFKGKPNAFLDAHASSLAALCKSLDVDSIVVASLYIDTPVVNFLSQGSKNLTMTISFFDRDGKLCHSVTDSLSGFSSTGGDLDAYAKMMDKYPVLVERLVRQLAGIKRVRRK